MFLRYFWETTTAATTTNSNENNINNNDSSSSNNNDNHNNNGGGRCSSCSCVWSLLIPHLLRPRLGAGPPGQAVDDDVGGDVARELEVVAEGEPDEDVRDLVLRVGGGGRLHVVEEEGDEGGAELLEVLHRHWLAAAEDHRQEEAAHAEAADAVRVLRIKDKSRLLLLVTEIILDSRTKLKIINGNNTKVK